MDKEQSKLYRKTQWRDCRERILQRDNYKCCRCGKTHSEVNLQVHHIYYDPSKKPWEYLDINLITLCKGCHAQEHGKIMPQSEWEYCGEEDLGDLVGECEACGNQIRYEHLIFHRNWGWLTVGCQCADRLTATNTASIVEKRRKEEAKKFKTFRDSSKWKHSGQGYHRTYKEYKISIWDNITSFRIDIWFYYHDRADVPQTKKLASNKKYKTLEDAKYAVYDAIISGELKSHIDKNYGHLYYKGPL